MKTYRKLISCFTQKPVFFVNSDQHRFATAHGADLNALRLEIPRLLEHVDRNMKAIVRKSSH